MTIVVGVLAASVLAAGFAFVGELAQGRRSHGAVDWSTSFLIGAGTCAAVLFPLSLVFGARALDAELALMFVAAVFAGSRRWPRQPDSSSRPHSASQRADPDLVVRYLLTVVLCVAAFFAVFNFWYGNSWDSVQVFGTRAKMLFHQGGLTRWWFPEDSYDTRLLAYPPMISLAEALFSRVQGAFDFDRLKPIFLFFYASLLVSTYAAARAVVSRRWALAAVLLVALLPEITTRGAAGGYVDMPMAAYVAATTATALKMDSDGEGWRSPLPWLLGSMTAVKQEGMILAVVACGSVSLYWRSGRPRRLAERLRANASGVIVVAAFILARIGYVRWTRVEDTTWGPFDAAHLKRAAHSAGLVVSLCLRYMLDPRTWGLFWPAFLVAAIGLATSGPIRIRLLVLATATCVALEAGLFLFTNWDFQLHIEGAYPRLLAQLAPAAAVAIVYVGSRLWPARTGVAT